MGDFGKNTDKDREVTPKILLLKLQGLEFLNLPQEHQLHHFEAEKNSVCLSENRHEYHLSVAVDVM